VFCEPDTFRIGSGGVCFVGEAMLLLDGFLIGGEDGELFERFRVGSSSVDLRFDDRLGRLGGEEDSGLVLLSTFSSPFVSSMAGEEKKKNEKHSGSSQLNILKHFGPYTTSSPTISMHAPLYLGGFLSCHSYLNFFTNA
jgi:hypothetical protein